MYLPKQDEFPPELYAVKTTGYIGGSQLIVADTADGVSGTGPEIFGLYKLVAKIRVRKDVRINTEIVEFLCP